MSKRSFTREIWPERIVGLQQSETFRLPIDTARYKARGSAKWASCPSLRIGDNFPIFTKEGFLFHLHSAATMNQKSSLREDPQFVSSVPTGNKRKLKRDE